MTKLIKKLKQIVLEQESNEVLWFDAKYVTEAYLQNELKRLHVIIKKLRG